MTRLMQRVEPRVCAWLCALCLLGAHAPAYAKPKQRKAEPPAQAAEAPKATPQPEPQPQPVDPEPGEELKPAPQAQPQPQPKAAEPAAEQPKAANSEELASLQTELGTLMDDMVQARTRAALVGKTLFKTLVRVKVQNLAGRDIVLGKIVLKLDGSPIFRGDGASLRGDEERQVFEGFIAPGPHVLSAELEQNSKLDQAYGYSLRESYKFQALRDKRNELSLVLRDGSDMASEFPDDQDGEYDVRVRVRARTKELTDE